MHYHSEALIRDLSAKAQTFRIQVLEWSTTRRPGTSAAPSPRPRSWPRSIFHHLRLDPPSPDWPDRDRLLFSKGHACAMLYTALAYRGFFPVEELLTFRQLDSRLQGHPDRVKTARASRSAAGPLGHGVAIGVGMALAQRACATPSHRPAARPRPWPPPARSTSSWATARSTPA